MISTTDYPSVETTTAASGEELYAKYISAPASSMSPAAIAEHLQQNQITFEIPSAHDLRHIDALNSFNALLQRIGNAAVTYDPAPPSGWSPDGSISTEQLSKSVVLDLADLRDRSEEAGESSWWGQIFGDADMHVIINYLWIGVVSSLVVLSLVFILFSCYFYRKFRTWKKCNKDIRAQIHAASDSYSSHLVGCDASRLLLHQQLQGQHPHPHQHHRNNEAGFYQIESPPCYTIATGLPSYDEALHHQPRHFAYGMKFVYPSLAAVHHHHQAACISNWEKEEQSLNKLQKCKLSAAVAVSVEEEKAQCSSSSSSSSSTSQSCNLAAATPAICINMPNGRQQEQEQREEEEDSAMAVAVAQSLQPAAAADDDCASLVVVVAA